MERYRKLLIECINNEINVAKSDIHLYEDNLDKISFIDELLKELNSDEWYSIFEDTTYFIERMQFIDKNYYNDQIASTYLTNVQIYSDIKQLELTTINPNSIIDMANLKYQLINFLSLKKYRLNRDNLTYQTQIKNKEDYTKLLEKLNKGKLLDDSDIKLIEKTLVKYKNSNIRYIKYKSTQAPILDDPLIREILIYIMKYNENIFRKNETKRKTNVELENIDKEYEISINDIFDNQDELSFFYDMLDLKLYMTMSIEELKTFLEDNLKRYQSQFYSEQYYKSSFYKKFILGLKLTFEKLQHQFALTQPTDISEIQIADLRARIEVCENFFINDKEDDNGFDINEVYSKIQNSDKCIILFGIPEDDKMKGTFDDTFDSTLNDVQADLKHIRKVISYFVETKTINEDTALNYSLIARNPKLIYHMPDCINIKPSKKSDVRFMIKRLEDNVFYVLGVWSKGDENDYFGKARGVHNSFQNQYRHEILALLHSEKRNQLIMENLEYMNKILKVLDDKIVDKNINKSSNKK